MVFAVKFFFALRDCGQGSDRWMPSQPSSSFFPPERLNSACSEKCTEFNDNMKHISVHRPFRRDGTMVETGDSIWSQYSGGDRVSLIGTASPQQWLRARYGPSSFLVSSDPYRICFDIDEVDHARGNYRSGEQCTTRAPEMFP